VPALRAASSDFRIGVPVVIETIDALLRAIFVAGLLPGPASPAATSELFLTTHALLI
jgi:hypothetical protein